MSVNDLEGLKKQRSTYRGLLTKLVKFANSVTEKSTETIEELRLKVNRAKEVLDKIDVVEGSIFAINNAEESKMEDSEDAYYTIVATLNNWIKKRTIGESSFVGHDISMNNTTTYAAPEVRLAKLKIPDFSGDYTEWQSFFDLFHSSVHSKDINPVQKFQYLMGLLKGDAFSLVKHFKITESNYIEALNKLRQRYDRKRHTVNAFIRHFLEQPSIHTVSAANVRKLLDTSDEVIRGLKAMGDQAEARDPWLIYLMQQKLDEQTRSLWAQENTKDEFPTISEFFEFLVKRTDALESIKEYAIRPTRSNVIGKSKASFAITTKDVCIACNKDQHRLIDCNHFKGLSVDQRRKLISESRRCFNCLNPGHSVYNCRIRGRCRDCSYKHHTLLHVEAKTKALTSNTEKLNDLGEKPTKSYITNINKYFDTPSTTLKCTLQTVLPTAIVNVMDNFGYPRPCRALLDTASQASFVTETMVQKLGLSRVNCRTLLAGIGETSGRSHGSTTLQLTSRFESTHLATVNALIIPKITSSLPSFEFDISGMKGLEGIKLADPYFYKPGSIDILIGADIVFELLGDTKRKIDKTNLIAHETKLGWIIGGRYDSHTKEPMHSFTTIVDIDATLQRFWAIEEVPQFNEITKEEEECENWFTATTVRADDGRFITKLPFKESRKPIGSTYEQAISRLRAMEKRFNANPHFHQLYKEFLHEYEELHHMEPANISNAELKGSYILPHHGVLKESSSTTKLRVVFDASAKSTTGVAMNENLMVGPNVQSSLFQILTRFRQHRYVLVGDIEKMYRQVLINNADTKNQLILWRDEQQRIRPYTLNTVTYGMASASFIATRCLQELAQLHEDSHPAASRAIKYDIYVDDLMTGASELSELTKLKDNVVAILGSGGFNLRKMSSNDMQMRDMLKRTNKDNLKILSDQPEVLKLLGLAWDASTDHFVFQINLDVQNNKLHTKRSFLSEAGKIFDPLGLLAPLTIRVKILFQSLWLQRIGWDDELPPESKESWINIRENLRQMPKLKIPRYVSLSNKVSIHGFCDASQWAYAAVVYARSQSSQGIVTQLICAKTKVAPLKQISIPRLELMGAVLLSRLVAQITNILSFTLPSVTMWTDSKIVLDWLSSQPRRWPTFIANRTSEIIGVHKRDLWRHVRTNYNPADCATRGKTAEEMFKSKLWWNGPDWLANDEHYWPDQSQIPEINEEAKIEVHKCVVTSSGKQDIIMTLSKKYSSFFKLQNVMSYVLRFCNNVRTNKQGKQCGMPSPQELKASNHKIILYWQIVDFGDEYRCLQNNKPINKRSKLRQLNPFLDIEGIMRVGGRLQKSMLPYNTIHPAIISPKAPIATSITYDVHMQKQHPGTNLLMSLVRQNFWIIRGKEVAKNIFRKCTKCLRQNPKMMKQIMGQLPEERVTITAAFGAVGLDFCGPFKIHPVRRRGSIPVKAYLCIFVCFSTHAVHIEICMNLTTDSFLGALRRFISRRGLCHSINCDNATNFVGANNYLREIYDFISKHNNQIISNLSRDKIAWRFIPPAAPNQGGLWEGAVKSTKTQISRSIGAEILTIEEFSTLTVQIEGILNSRPICPDQNDELEFLTPAHFLIGRAIHQIPEGVIHENLHPHTRWDIVNRIYLQFWKRWRVEYLTSLQSRTKWTVQHKNIQLHDVVLIQDHNLPPTQWLMGRVIKLYPGNDNNVRVVDVKTKTGILKRPIQKLCRLPILES